MTQSPNSPLLPAGKLPSALLSQLLGALPTQHVRLLVGPAVGEDAAVIDWGMDWGDGEDRLLVAKSDPITFATDAIGYYAVNVCANDLGVTGARPLFYLPTVLFPTTQTDIGLYRGCDENRSLTLESLPMANSDFHTEQSIVEQIFQQIGEACRQLGIVVAGGHSEITHAVNQPVIAGTMLGAVRRSQMIAGSGAQPGDVLLMAGLAPVEGASLIAREKRQALLDRGWQPKELDQAANYLYEPGISVLRPALLAAEAGLVTAMHDPTEGGIATGLSELASAAKVGLTINLDALLWSDLAVRLCATFGLDPLGVIASGALLATTTPTKVEALRALWQAHGWPVAQVGQVTTQEQGIRAYQQGQPVPFPHFATDEITKLWM